MNRYEIYLDGKFCSCCEMGWKISKKSHCIICEGIVEKEEIVLLINNYKLFPNCIAHINCLPEGKVNEDVLRMLKDDYDNIKEQYDSITKKAKKWGLGE